MTEQVWVIDDDPGIRYVLEEYLRSQGLGPRIFAQGEELIQAFRHHAPDLVLADIRLDGRDGLELMQALRRSRPDLPVIIMTAYSDLDYAVRAFQGGAFEFMAKPFDLHELGRLIRKALKAQPGSADHAAAIDGDQRAAAEIAGFVYDEGRAGIAGYFAGGHVLDEAVALDIGGVEP